MTLRWLKFEEVTRVDRKTKVFSVQSLKNEDLGQIVFRPQWRRYVFEPKENTIFDASCLFELSGFLNKITAEWRSSL